MHLAQCIYKCYHFWHACKCVIYIYLTYRQFYHIINIVLQLSVNSQHCHQWSHWVQCTSEHCHCQFVDWKTGTGKIYFCNLNLPITHHNTFDWLHVEYLLCHWYIQLPFLLTDRISVQSSRTLTSQSGSCVCIGCEYNMAVLYRHDLLLFLVTKPLRLI